MEKDLDSFRICSSDKTKNVATTQWSASTFQQRSYRVLESRLSRNVDRIRWTSCMTIQVAKLAPLGFFLWGCMKSMTYHTGMPETRQKLLECINKAAAAIRNQVETHQTISTFNGMMPSSLYSSQRR
jgi:hypothetical protein